MATETSIFEDDTFKTIRPHNAHVMRPLAEIMPVSLVLNSESKVWLLHEKPFEDIVMWAEYDIEDATLALIMRDGKIQELGLPIHPPVRKLMRQSRQIHTMYVNDDGFHDAYILPLLVREMPYHKV